MRIPAAIRSPAFWQKLWVAAMIASLVIMASVALVTLRNRNRAATTAVQWALDSLQDVPAETVAMVFAPDRYIRSLSAFRVAILANRIPVDSVRAFYAAYVRQARDGVFVAAELAELGPYFGLKPIPAVPDSVGATPSVADPDSTTRPRETD